MFHLTPRHLQGLLDRSITTADVQRIRQHVRECRACARRLEEWRDDHPAIDRRYPNLERAPGTAVGVTAGGLVVMPGGGSTLPAWLRPRRLVWYSVGVLILGGAGSAAWMLRPHPEVMTVVMPDSALPRLKPPTAAPDYGPAPDSGATGRETPPHVEPLPVSDEFRAITGREAVSRLGVPLRLIQGTDPDHFETGPPSAAPGAQRGAALVRVVYRAPDDGRVHLDQQFIRADSTGFRPIDDSNLENGDTVYRAKGTRRSATWLDDAGYLLTLSGPLTDTQLRALISQVK